MQIRKLKYNLFVCIFFLHNFKKTLLFRILLIHHLYNQIPNICPHRESIKIKKIVECDAIMHK